MASNRQRHPPDPRTLRQAVTGAPPGHSHGPLRVPGVREGLLQRGHLAVGPLTWDTHEKREAMENMSRDKPAVSAVGVRKQNRARTLQVTENEDAYCKYQRSLHRTHE